jgi:hypothetical protein
MKTYRFPSLAAPNRVVFTYDTGFHTDGGVSSHMRWYDTYGDGAVAHTPAYPIQVGQLADYLMSLAKAMLTDKDLRDAAGYELTAGVASNAEIAFALGVTYKDDGKTRYFSREEQKVSPLAAKRHDKRYHEITARHDGTVDGAYNVLWRDHYDGIRALALVHSILRYLREVRGQYMGIALDRLGWNVDREAVESAYNAACGVVAAHNHLYNAERAIAYAEKKVAEAQAAPAPEELVG